MLRQVKDLYDRIALLQRRCCCQSFGLTDGAPTEEPTNGVEVLFDPATGILYYWDSDSWEIYSPASAASYSVYTALLNQTSTNAPVATILENTIGSIVWSYDSEGTYTGTLVGAFTAAKTWLTINNPRQLDETTQPVLRRINDDTIRIHCYEPAGFGPDDNVLTDCSIEIRVYP